jgi:hypothetical protein
MGVLKAFHRWMLLLNDSGRREQRKMIRDTLILLGMVLIIFPTWLYFSIFTSKEKKFLSRLIDSLVLFRKKPQELLEIYEPLIYYQIWGLFWVLCGLFFAVIGENTFNDFLGNMVLALVFLSPLVILAVIATRRKIKKDE